MSFCPQLDQGLHSFREEDLSALRRRLSGPDACELSELAVARGVARRLRQELIYGWLTAGQTYTEENVPTSRNLPLFMRFVFEILTDTEDPGEEYE